MKLLSEFGRGKDKKKRVRRQIGILKNRIKKQPGKSTERAIKLGAYAGTAVGGVLSLKALKKLNHKLPNNIIGMTGIGLGTTVLTSAGLVGGAIAGMKYNNKVRKKSLYE